MVIPRQHFYISKESTQRDLSFELHNKFIEQNTQNLWSSKVVTTSYY